MTEELQYQGARFYKCALQLNPYDYRHTYQGNAPQDENEYNRSVLQHCQNNEIAVVGLADHGKVESSEPLKNFLVKNGITVFPGFEIASSEGIHMVCLYPQETDTRDLNHYLRSLMGDNATELSKKPTANSSLSCQEMAKLVLGKQKGFWYAAHATNSKGILRLTKAGDNHLGLWKKDDLVAAVQIPGTIDNLPADDEGKCRAIIENRNPDYKRDRPVAVINAKDIVKPENLSDPSASCLIKMTRPTFAAFKSAFRDHTVRICLNQHVPPAKNYSRILSVRWKGAGFFENNGIILSPHLNVAIGGRGSGKSTLLESIRFALDLPLQNPEDEKSIAHFRKHTLQNAQVILEVASSEQRGQRYTISRRYGEGPIVQDEQNNISNLTPQDILPNMEFFGQNEILQIGKDENKKLQLLRRFILTPHLDKDIAALRQSLQTNRTQLSAAEKRFDSLNSQLNTREKLKEQEALFKKLGIEDKLKYVRLLEKEKKIKNSIAEQLTSVYRWCAEDYQEIFNLAFLERPDIEQLPNKSSIIATREVLVKLQSTLNRLSSEAENAVEEAQNQWNTLQTDWQNKTETIKNTLDQAIAQLPNCGGKQGKELGKEYQEISQQLSALEELLKVQEIIKNDRAELYSVRQKLLKQYRDSAFERSNNMSSQLKKLSKKLEGNLKISLTRKNNREKLKQFLLNEMAGVGPTKIKWLDDSGCEIDLTNWSQWIQERNAYAFVSKYGKYGVTSNTADKLVGLDVDKRLALEEIELEDTVEIELNTAHQGQNENFAALSDLSTGQKCTAILNLMLLHHHYPLIIDQPEDNLDNAFIAERIVDALRGTKTDRQYIFATHNANIPIFGDADLIVVLACQKNIGTIVAQGSTDKEEIQQQAAEILEGGRAAFSIRKDKYGF